MFRGIHGVDVCSRVSIGLMYVPGYPRGLVYVPGYPWE